MTKAMRDMEEKRELCDGVICVLDARAPAATLNKNLKKVFGEKPILYLLNKADLADSGADGFLKLIEEKGRACVKCNASDVSSKRTLVQKLSAMTEEKRARAEAKGLNRTFRFMVAGIPNTGKSTVVNLLSGQKRAKTGDKAGVTRDVRWLRCGTFDLLDTPGTMPPSFDNQTLARHLAVRLKNEKPDTAYTLLSTIETKFRDNGFTTRRAGKEDLKRLLAIYFEQNTTTERFEDYDGQRFMEATG